MANIVIYRIFIIKTIYLLSVIFFILSHPTDRSTRADLLKADPGGRLRDAQVPNGHPVAKGSPLHRGSLYRQHYCQVINCVLFF